MQILVYILSQWSAFEAHLARLVDFHKATGTLPVIADPPAAGQPSSPPAASVPANPQSPAPAAAAALPAGFPDVSSFPIGVTLADATNGLVFIDPSVSGNPDTAGQRFIVQPARVAFAPNSQAVYTIDQNAAEETLADRPVGALGMHPRVRPMIANPSGRYPPFVSAPSVIGEMDRVPYLENAWTIGGGTWSEVFANLKPDSWHRPTSAAPNPGAFFNR